MNKSDKSDNEIWQDSLKSARNSRVFETAPGGKKAQPLPKRDMFKTSTDKKVDARLKDLEKLTVALKKELRQATVTISELKKQINILKNKKPPQQQQQRPNA
tara:strand:- start:7660 stop:7965 length:306 start_codon:yes stop_codon:yes gene_type:complete